MMVPFFGPNGHFAHPSKGINKIDEFEALLEAIVFFFPHKVVRAKVTAMFGQRFSLKSKEQIEFLGLFCVKFLK